MRKSWIVVINVIALIFVPFAFDIFYYWLTGKSVQLSVFKNTLEMTLGIYLFLPIAGITNIKYNHAKVLKILGGFYFIFWILFIARLIHDVFFL